MAALIQKAPNTTLPAEGNNVTSLAVTFNTKPTAGNFIGVLWAINSNGASALVSLVDNQTNVYTVGKSQADGGTAVAAVYYVLSALTGSPFTVTITFTSLGFFDMGLVEFQGVDTTGSPVVTAGSTGNTAAPSPGALNGPNSPQTSLYLGVFGTDNVDATGLVATSGIPLWTEPSSIVEAAGMSYFAGVSGSQTFSWSKTGANILWTAAGAAFREAPSGPTTFPNTPTSNPLAKTVWQGVGG